ncbi:MAG: flippase-like domain-containing protein [Candidatus Pacebacteria bacterium]|nr:flippase-like domain-containing protein [Candidatus Paceibacterota bacterium]
MIARYRKFVIKLVITGLVLFLLFSAVDIKAVGAHITDVSLGTIALAGLCYIAATLISTVRWALLLRVQGVSLPFRHLIAYNVSYTFYSLVLPGGKVAAEAVRVYQIARDAKDDDVRGKVIFPTLLDRASAVFAAAIVAITYFAFAGAEALAELPTWFPYAAIVLIILIVLSVFLPVEKILKPLFGMPSQGKTSSTLASLTAALQIYRTHPFILGATAALSFLMLATISVGVWVIAASLGYYLPFVLIFGIFSTSMVAAFLPLTVAGVGIREGTFAYVLAAASSVSIEAALSISLIALISSHIVTLCGGLVEFHRHFLQKSL